MRVFIWASRSLDVELVSLIFAAAEVELTCLRICGKFFVAGTILQTYIAAYTALARANSSDRRAAVRTIMLALMLSLVSMIAIVLLRTISLTSATILVLLTQTETLPQCEVPATPPYNARRRDGFSSPDCRPPLTRLQLSRPLMGSRRPIFRSVDSLDIFWRHVARRRLQAKAETSSATMSSSFPLSGMSQEGSGALSTRWAKVSIHAPKPPVSGRVIRTERRGHHIEVVYNYRSEGL